MITHILALLIGFVAGALVFRNNKAKADGIVDSAKKLADKFKK
jgi:hypothetical protein